MRTTVDIEARLLRQLRSEANRLGVTLKEVLNNVIRRGLTQRERTPSRPVRLPTYDMGEPLLSLDRAMRVAEALEDSEVARDLALRK